MIKAKASLKGKINYVVEYVEPVTQEKTAIPTEDIQEIIPDKNITGLSKVIIQPIPNEYAKTEGTLAISNNGEYNVKTYEKVNVQTSPKIVDIDYTKINDNASYTNFYYMITHIYDVDLSSISRNHCKYLFANLINLIYLPDQIEIPQNITNIANMFNSCNKLTKIPEMNTSNINDMSSLFAYCSNLESIPLLDVANVKYTSSMFTDCSKLKELPDLSFGDLSSGNSMFLNCSNLLNLNNIKINKISGLLSHMFFSCFHLKNLPVLQNKDFSGVTYMGNFANSCYILEDIVSFFGENPNTTNCTDFSNAFRACYLLKDLPVFDFSKAKNLASMFDSILSKNNLTDNALNNILLSCCTVGSSYTSTKTLKTLFNATLGREYQARIQSLPAYQQFLDAGWTIN